MGKPAICDDYLDLTTTYCVYAKNIWHEADVGGYWGGGIAEKNANGAVRGMANTCLGYATLVHALDHGWLSGDLLGRLDAAKLDRSAMLRYIRANLKHLAAHHLSAPQALEPKWGFSWQSSLWVGGFGPAALLVWDDLPPALRDDLKRVVFAEADRIAAKPPKDYQPGDTGAEENAWDTHAPAVALAMDPYHAHAERWLEALRKYAVNTYSVPADRTSDAKVGQHRVRALVTTSNLFDDFTLENHRFFHPDYVQVSGQLLGEAWLYLQLGDRIHGTSLAKEFQPYALHHAREVWENVAKPLILPTGELAFPSGTDWTVNCSIIPSYLAYIATGLGDPDALRAMIALPRQALRHRELSPPGRVFGDTNIEWFWEPILIKRSCTAILQLELRGNPVPPAGSFIAQQTHKLLPDSKVWIYRNARYFVSASWGKRTMGTFTPFDPEHPYLTYPLERGILPESVDRFVEEGRNDGVNWIVLESRDGRRSALVLCVGELFIHCPFVYEGVPDARLGGGTILLHRP